MTGKPITWGELQDMVFPINVNFNDNTNCMEVFYNGTEVYEIESERLLTEHDLILWIRQLSQKNWCNNKIICELISETYQIWGKQL